VKRAKRCAFYRDDAGGWRWHVKARNGEIVADSAESYENRTDCVREAVDLFGSTVTYEIPRDDLPDDAA
jgi:uncharacterized protein YegP (UPF0339 family)